MKDNEMTFLDFMILNGDLHDTHYGGKYHIETAIKRATTIVNELENPDIEMERKQHIYKTLQSLHENFLVPNGYEVPLPPIEGFPQRPENRKLHN